MKKFDVTELNYGTFDELVEQIKDVHMMDLKRRFHPMDLVEGDPYLVDGNVHYYLTEIGIRNYFPIVAKVIENENGSYSLPLFALGW